LSDDPALSGEPGRLTDELLARFRPDEIEAAPYASPTLRRKRDIMRHGMPLGRAEKLFILHRHRCEVADQWFWGEVTALAGAGREALVLEHGERVPDLRDGVRLPVRAIRAIFTRPFYLFDEGLVLSLAYRWNDRLVFVHELVARTGSRDKPHAIALEEF
jgi:hypothetical protein